MFGSSRKRFAGYKKNAEGKDALIDTFADAQAFALEADGVSLDGSFQYIGFHKEKEIIENTDAAVLHGCVTLRSRIKPIEVAIHTVLDGTPVMTRWMEVKNLSDQSVNISAISPMCGGVEVIDRWKSYMKGAPDPSKIYSLGYMDQSLWGHEGLFKWQDLPNAMYEFSSKYRYDRFRHPFFVLKNKLLGTVMIAQLGWSRSYRFEFYANADSDTAKLSFQAAVEAAEREFSDCDAVLTQLETGLRSVLKCKELAQKYHKPFILNPASYQEIPEGLFEGIDFLTPNETEAEQFTNQKVDSPESGFLAAEILLNRDVKNVVITLGKAGAIDANSEERGYIPAICVDTIDTTGAGDAFNGGLAAAIAAGMSIEKALRFAKCAGALSVTAHGTAPAMPRLDRLKEFMKKHYGIEVTELD